MPSRIISPEGIFLLKGTIMDWFDTGKDLFNKGKRWLETAGDMTSASINPQEKTGWIDEQQKRIEQEQKNFRPQTGLTGIRQNSRQSRSQPDPVTPSAAPVPADNDPIYDWTGHPVSEEERQRILVQKAQERASNSDDMNDMLDRMKLLREERNSPNKMAFRFDSDVPGNNPRTEQKSAFEQAAETAIPQDDSMMPVFRHLGEAIMKALGDESAVSGYGRSPVGMTDQSYNSATDALANNITENLGNQSAVSGYGRAPVGHSDMSYKSATDAAAKNITDNLGDTSAVSGYGRAPVGFTDQSYDPAIGDVSKNFGLESAVTGKGRQVIGHPNMSYRGNWDDGEIRKMPLDFTSKGVQQGAKDLQILFYSGASLAGEHLFNLVGGDDTSLRRVQGILDRHQQELKGMNRMTSDQIYIEGAPEKTIENVTRYLYQELGNRTVKLPAYFVAAHLNTFAQLFGVSSAILSTQLYSDFREKTGDGHAAESVMYGIPLGLMSAALLPFRDSGVFRSAKEVKDYVQSMVVGAAVHKARKDGRRMVVDAYPKKPDIGY